MGHFEFPHKLQESDWVAFLHISKTGGLTFLPLLDSLFPPEQRCVEHNVKLLEVEELQKYRLFRSHGTYDELRRIFPHPPIWLTFVRDPIERAFSTYKYILRVPDHEIADLIKGMSFDDFVFAEAEVNGYIRNYQTRILVSNLDYDTEPDVELAIKRLREEFLFVGLTEEYERSLELMCYSLCAPPFLSVEHRNKTKDPIRKSDVAPRTLERLHKMNALDIRMYEAACDVYHSRRREMMHRLLIEHSTRVFCDKSPFEVAKDVDEALKQHSEKVNNVIDRLKKAIWS